MRTCREAGIRVVPLPGPCAAITALSAAGLPSDRFCYEGFLPAKSKGRRDALKAIEAEPRTLIFYESTHRLLDSLEDIVAVLGESRYVVLARELTNLGNHSRRARWRSCWRGSKKMKTVAKAKWC